MSELQAGRARGRAAAQALHRPRTGRIPPLSARRSPLTCADRGRDCRSGRRQGLFWEMHDLLFAHQPHFQQRHLRELAQGLRLDIRRFSEELKERVHVTRIREDVKSGRLIGVRTTPTFYVNGPRKAECLDL